CHLTYWPLSDFFFFFQEEDGIRDFHVTGVQTCALPICRTRDESRILRAKESNAARNFPGLAQAAYRYFGDDFLKHRRGHSSHHRSEERRVGKEWRSRWAP